MLIQVEVSDYVIQRHIELSGTKPEEGNEAAFAKIAYDNAVVRGYLYPINPDGTLETEYMLMARIYSLLTAAAHTCLNLKLNKDEVNTARGMINMCKLAFGGKNGK